MKDAWKEKTGYTVDQWADMLIESLRRANESPEYKEMMKKAKKKKKPRKKMPPKADPGDRPV